jgi:hypothetical protein
MPRWRIAIVEASEIKKQKNAATSRPKGSIKNQQ